MISFFLAADCLLGRRNQRRIDHLPAPSDEAFFQVLMGDRLEQRNSPGLPKPVLKGPEGCPIRNIKCLGQPAETLVTQRL